MAKVLNITRKQDRADVIRYEVLIEHQVDGVTCQGTFNLNYGVDDPDDAQLDADIARCEFACDLFEQVKQQLNGDARAEACWIDDAGDVRVLLANRACPAGCIVRALAELPLALARLPKPRRVPDTAALLARRAAAHAQ